MYLYVDNKGSVQVEGRRTEASHKAVTLYSVYINEVIVSPPDTPSKTEVKMFFPCKGLVLAFGVTVEPGFTGTILSELIPQEYK